MSKQNQKLSKREKIFWIIISIAFISLVFIGVKDTKEILENSEGTYGLIDNKNLVRRSDGSYDVKFGYKFVVDGVNYNGEYLEMDTFDPKYRLKDTVYVYYSKLSPDKSFITSGKLKSLPKSSIKAFLVFDKKIGIIALLAIAVLLLRLSLLFLPYVFTIIFFFFRLIYNPKQAFCKLKSNLKEDSSSLNEEITNVLNRW